MGPARWRNRAITRESASAAMREFSSMSFLDAKDLWPPWTKSTSVRHPTWLKRGRSRRRAQTISRGCVHAPLDGAKYQTWTSAGSLRTLVFSEWASNN
eukprot:11208701-Lingulodinium_polyedra.AAC.1